MEPPSGNRGSAALESAPEGGKVAIDAEANPLPAKRPKRIIPSKVKIVPDAEPIVTDPDVLLPADLTNRRTRITDIRNCDAPNSFIFAQDLWAKSKLSFESASDALGRGLQLGIDMQTLAKYPLKNHKEKYRQYLGVTKSVRMINCDKSSSDLFALMLHIDEFTLALPHGLPLNAQSDICHLPQQVKKLNLIDCGSNSAAVDKWISELGPKLEYLSLGFAENNIQLSGKFAALKTLIISNSRTCVDENATFPALRNLLFLHNLTKVFPWKSAPRLTSLFIEDVDEEILEILSTITQLEHLKVYYRQEARFTNAIRRMKLTTVYVRNEIQRYR